VAVLPARLGVPESQAERRSYSETPEERPTADGPPAVGPPRRRLLRSEGAKGSRSLIFLLAALVVEVAWLAILVYALFHYLA
jgi:hypothetical protein